MLVRADFGCYVGKIFKRPMTVFFGLSGNSAAALILGLICGFPIGAKTAANMYSRGELTKREFEKLLSFCNYPSAPFVIFAIGKNMLGNVTLGAFIYALNITAGLAYGIITRARHSSANKHISIEKSGKKESMIGIFTDSVASAAGSVISVCALVTFFTCAVGCLSAIKAIDGAPVVKALLFSFFELTSGAAACASLTSRRLAAILTACAVGWSGLSVFMQIYSTCCAQENAPSLVPYLKSKIVSSAACAAGTASVLYAHPSLLPEKLPAADAFLLLSAFPSPFIYSVNILFIASVLFCVNKNLTDGK